MSASDENEQRLDLRIAAFGLPGCIGLSAPVTVGHDEWPYLLRRLSWQRLTGLAMAAMETDQLRLSGPQIEQLVECQMGAMHHVLQLERTLLAIAETLEAADVEMVVLKGSALAQSAYPDPSWRPFGDIDVLVHARDWQKACRVLAESGFTTRFPEPRPGFRSRFGHTACHVNQAGLELDLHRTLVAGPFGLWMDPDELFEETATFRLGDALLGRLDDTAIFTHACIHASLGYRPPLLLPIRDVAQVVTTLDIDWDRINDWADRWKLRVVIRHALMTTADLLGWEIPNDARAFVGTGSAGAREQRALEAYTTDRRSRGGTALASLSAIPGLRAKAAYMLAVVVPSREFVEFREGARGWASYYSRWRKPARWLARR